MFFQSWSDFFAMGGYGFYVWLAYAVCGVGVVALVVQSIRSRSVVIAEVIRENRRRQCLQEQQKRGETL